MAVLYNGGEQPLAAREDTRNMSVLASKTADLTVVHFATFCHLGGEEAAAEKSLEHPAANFQVTRCWGAPAAHEEQRTGLGVEPTLFKGAPWVSQLCFFSFLIAGRQKKLFFHLFHI